MIPAKPKIGHERCENKSEHQREDLSSLFFKNSTRRYSLNTAASEIAVVKQAKKTVPVAKNFLIAPKFEQQSHVDNLHPQFQSQAEGCKKPKDSKDPRKKSSISQRQLYSPRAFFFAPLLHWPHLLKDGVSSTSQKGVQLLNPTSDTPLQPLLKMMRGALSNRQWCGPVKETQSKKKPQRSKQ